MDLKEMILSPERWPIAGILPVKRMQPHSEWYQLGLIFRSNTRIVVEANLCEPYTWPQAKRFRYGSVEELVADGWEGD